MATLGGSIANLSGFQQALSDVLARACRKSESLFQHEFFRIWADRNKIQYSPSATVVSDHCLTCSDPNVALIHISRAVNQLDWPVPSALKNTVHPTVVEVVELMTLVLCERCIQEEQLKQKDHEKEGLLTLPMNNHLAASLVAAAWLQFRVKPVLDDSGNPVALNVLDDLPPQEFGWNDGRQAAKAELMAYLNHVGGGGEVYRPESIRHQQLAAEKEDTDDGTHISDKRLKDFLKVHADEGHAKPVFGLRSNLGSGLDYGSYQWLYETLGIECFVVGLAGSNDSGKNLRNR